MEVIGKYCSIYLDIYDKRYLKLFKASCSFTRISQFLAGLILQPITTEFDKNPMILAFSKLLASDFDKDGGECENYIKDEGNESCLISLSPIISFLVLLDLSEDSDFPFNEDFDLLKKLVFYHENSLDENSQNSIVAIINKRKPLSSENILEDVIEKSKTKNFFVLKILLSLFKISDFDTDSHINFRNITNKFIHMCGINHNIVYYPVKCTNLKKNINGEIVNAFIFNSYVKGFYSDGNEKSDADLSDVYSTQINGDEEEEEEDKNSYSTGSMNKDKNNVFYAVLRKRSNGDGSSIGPYIGAYFHDNHFFYYSIEEESNGPVCYFKKTTASKNEFNVDLFISYDSEPVFDIDRSQKVPFHLDNLSNDGIYYFLKKQFNIVLSYFSKNLSDSFNNSSSSINNSIRNSISSDFITDDDTILYRVFKICAYALTPFDKYENGISIDDGSSILNWIDAACCLMELAPFISSDSQTEPHLKKEVQQLIGCGSRLNMYEEFLTLTMVIIVSTYKICYGTGKDSSNFQGSDAKFLPNWVLKCKENDDVKNIEKYCKVPSKIDNNISRNVAVKTRSLASPSVLVEDFLKKYFNFIKYPEYDCEVLYKNLVNDGIHCEIPKVC